MHDAGIYPVHSDQRAICILSPFGVRKGRLELICKQLINVTHQRNPNRLLALHVCKCVMFCLYISSKTPIGIDLVGEKTAFTSITLAKISSLLGRFGVFFFQGLHHNNFSPRCLEMLIIFISLLCQTLQKLLKLHMTSLDHVTTKLINEFF